MTDWYKVFPLATKHFEAEAEATDEGGGVEEGAVLAAPSVITNRAAGAYTMTPSASEDEGGEDGEGSGVRDGDPLRDGGDTGGQRYCRCGVAVPAAAAGP